MTAARKIVVKRDFEKGRGRRKPTSGGIHFTYNFLKKRLLNLFEEGKDLPRPHGEKREVSNGFGRERRTW